MTESTLRLFPQEEPIYQKLGDYIREHSETEDRLFLWGYLPKAYYFSKRRPASRFVFTQFLTGSSPKTHGMDFDPEKPASWPSVWKRLALEISDRDPPLQVYDTSEYIVAGAWDLLMADLEKNKPLFIIDTAPANINRYGKYPLEKFPRLHEYIQRNYFFDTTIDRVDLYRRRQ